MSALYAGYWGERAVWAVRDMQPDMAYDHARIAAHLSGFTAGTHRAAIAQILSDAAHVEVGAEPRDLSELTLPLRDRFLAAADAALARSKTPLGQYERDLIDAAVQDTAEWMGGPYTGHVPTPREIARVALHFYRERERKAL